MKINETIQSDISIENLEIFLEDGDEMSAKVNQWVQESSQTVMGSVKMKIRQIIIRIKQLFGIRTYDKGNGNVRVLRDITAYNKLVRFIEGTTTYRVANFGPSQVASYGKNINMINSTFLGKDNREAKKLSNLYHSMKDEMNSRRAKMIKQAVTETKTIRVTDEMQFKANIVPFIRNLLIATKKMNVMINKMYKSFHNLVNHMTTINRKTKVNVSSRYIAHQKDDLVYRCINYVAYANKMLINTCNNCIEKIDKMLNYYYNIFSDDKE